MRKAKIKEIKVWYEFKPYFDIWFTKPEPECKSFYTPLLDETWYGGYLFYKGYFILIQMKYFRIHIKLLWWQMK